MEVILPCLTHNFCWSYECRPRGTIALGEAEEVSWKVLCLWEFYPVPAPDEDRKCHFLPCMPKMNDPIQNSWFQIPRVKFQSEKLWNCSVQSLLSATKTMSLLKRCPYSNCLVLLWCTHTFLWLRCKRGEKTWGKSYWFSNNCCTF